MPETTRLFISHNLHMFTQRAPSQAFQPVNKLSPGSQCGGGGGGEEWGQIRRPGELNRRIEHLAMFARSELMDKYQGRVIQSRVKITQG